MTKQPTVWLPEPLWHTYTDVLRIWRANNRQPVPSEDCYQSGIDRHILDRLQQRGALQCQKSLIQPNPNVHVAVLINSKPGPKPLPSIHYSRMFAFREHSSLAIAITDAAAAEGVSLSAWLRDAAQRKLESSQ